MQLIQAVATAAVAAAMASVVSGQTAGAYTGYSDTTCYIGGTNNFPIVNTCRPLPANSIVVTNQACGYAIVYTNSACTTGAKTVALNKCTDTSAYTYIKVKC